MLCQHVNHMPKLENWGSHLHLMLYLAALTCRSNRTGVWLSPLRILGSSSSSYTRCGRSILTTGITWDFTPWTATSSPPVFMAYWVRPGTVLGKHWIFLYVYSLLWTGFQCYSDWTPYKSVWSQHLFPHLQASSTMVCILRLVNFIVEIPPTNQMPQW